MVNFNIGDIISTFSVDKNWKYYGVISTFHSFKPRWVIITLFVVSCKEISEFIKQCNTLVPIEYITHFDINNLDKNSKLHNQIKIESNKFKLMRS